MSNPILSIRQAKNMSRAEFAKATGVSYQTLSYIELGYGQTVKDRTLNAIAEFSGQDPETIIEEYQAWKRELQEQA